MEWQIFNFTCLNSIAFDVSLFECVIPYLRSIDGIKRKFDPDILA